MHINPEKVGVITTHTMETNERLEILQFIMTESSQKDYYVSKKMPEWHLLLNEKITAENPFCISFQNEA